MSTNFQEISDGLADVVEAVGQSVVAVSARRRYPASGIVWSEDGVIVTANHVVRRDEQITVMLADGEDLPATLVGRDPSTDLVVLRIDVKGLTPAAWVDEENLRVGDLVLALGRPGRSLQASLGIISALAGAWRTGAGGKVSHYVKPDLVMYPGFSGGPLVAGSGALVGLATSGLTREGGVALTKSTVTGVVETLLAHGHMRRGYLGVGVQTVRLPQKGAEGDSDQKTGLLITSVNDGSPAEEGGLLVGDILVTFDGEAVTQPDDLSSLLATGRAGETVDLSIIRGGVDQTLSLTVGERA